MFMENKGALIKRRLWELVPAAAFFAALGCLFLPLLKTNGVNGEPIRFYGYLLIFGGNIEVASSSGVYSFAFRFNVWLLILMQALLLSSLAALLSFRNGFNRIFGLVLSMASLVFLCLAPVWVSIVSSMPLEGLRPAFGLYLSTGLAALGILIELAFFAKETLRRNKQK